MYFQHAEIYYIRQTLQLHWKQIATCQNCQLLITYLFCYTRQTLQLQGKQIAICFKLLITYFYLYLYLIIVLKLFFSVGVLGGHISDT